VFRRRPDPTEWRFVRPGWRIAFAKSLLLLCDLFRGIPANLGHQLVRPWRNADQPLLLAKAINRSVWLRDRCTGPGFTRRRRASGLSKSQKRRSWFRRMPQGRIQQSFVRSARSHSGVTDGSFASSLVSFHSRITNGLKAFLPSYFHNFHLELRIKVHDSDLGGGGAASRETIEGRRRESAITINQDGLASARDPARGSCSAPVEHQFHVRDDGSRRIT